MTFDIMHCKTNRNGLSSVTGTIKLKVSSSLWVQNIGIIHVFSCINICRVPRKLFEHEAARPTVQTSSKGPGKY